ncbi:hypothetical protein [Sporosarcina koreensis]|uniref:hypothetical protein n=1 Tax=Sporosarcina koreensis TaxID=334735 RepID=UPI001181980A|nr:hypothetical protein [Sporosarcina koreensis]
MRVCCAAWPFHGERERPRAGGTTGNEPQASTIQAFELCPDADTFGEVSDASCQMSDTSGEVSDIHRQVSDIHRQVSDMSNDLSDTSEAHRKALLTANNY